MSHAQRTRIVGLLSQVSALAGRIQRGAAYDADQIACGPDEDRREWDVRPRTLKRWLEYLARLDALIDQVIETDRPAIVDGPHLEDRAKTILVATEAGPSVVLGVCSDGDQAPCAHLNTGDKPEPGLEPTLCPRCGRYYFDIPF